MELLQTLQEASSHLVGDLKKVLSKDKRVKDILQKHLDIDDVRDKAEFLNTLKFMVLNNRNVKTFVDGRDYIKELNGTTLKRLRELRVPDLTQKTLDDLREFVANLFREYAYVDRIGITASTRKELIEWANANGRYFQLSGTAQQELKSIPGVRPTRPTLLYRGLLFGSYSLKERKRYDGTLEVGDGLKFLRSIREGTRIVDLEWDRASSWTTSKETAAKFAQFGPANSNFAATMQWLSRKDKIDGDLGFIISTLAQPEDILIDMSRLITAAHLKHGGENEFILAPGTYTCRVSTKFTKEGEVDPSGSTGTSDSVSEAISAVRNFASSFDTSEFEQFRSDTWNFADIRALLKQGRVDDFKNLTTAKVKDEAFKAFDELKSLYSEHLQNIDVTELQAALTDKKNTKIVEWIMEFQKFMKDKRNHSDFKSEKNAKGSTSVSEMSAKQFRDTKSSAFARETRSAFGPGRFTDRQTGTIVSELAKAFGNSSVSDVHRKSRKDQQEILDGILEEFFKAVGVSEPADRDEAVKMFLNSLTAADRTAEMISTIKSLSRELAGNE